MISGLYIECGAVVENTACGRQRRRASSRVSRSSLKRNVTGKNTTRSCRQHKRNKSVVVVLAVVVVKFLLMMLLIHMAL